MSKSQLTNREEYLLHVIATWRDEYDESPRRKDIAEVMGITPGRATQLVQALQDKGMIEREPYKPRSIRFTAEGRRRADEG